MAVSCVWLGIFIKAQGLNPLPNDLEVRGAQPPTRLLLLILGVALNLLSDRGTPDHLAEPAEVV